MGYETAEEAKMRLDGCVVMYDDQPVYVEGISGPNANLIATCYTLPRNRDRMEISINDPLFDSRAVRLGYTNCGRSAYYVSRMPVRRYKQGVCAQNTIAKSCDGRNVGFENVFRHAGFIESVKRKYPTLIECTQLLEKGEVDSVAFHHNFCLQRDSLGFYVLYFKGERAAWGDPSGFNLPSEYHWLEESLRENGVNLR